MALEITIILVLASSLLGSLGMLFFKKGSEKLTKNILTLITNKQVIFGLFCYGIATIIFITALKISELSIAYPLYATSYLWVTIFSAKFLGEKITHKNWIGVAIIIIGIILTTI